MVEVKSLDHTLLVLMAARTNSNHNTYYRGGKSNKIWTTDLSEAIVFSCLNDVRSVMNKLPRSSVGVKYMPKVISKKEVMIARIKG